MPATFTNTHGLPEALVRAVTNDPYRGGGDISATALIDAPQKVTLAKRHADDVQIDVSERIWALLGQAVHNILERGALEAGQFAEERLYADMEGWKVSGQYDLHDWERRAIVDYKVTTVYKANGNDSWTRQLNVLRWLAHQNNLPIDRLEIVAIFRDWRKGDADRKADYPQAPVKVIEVPVWDLAEAEQYVRERVIIHQAARGGLSVPCTDEERWYSGTQYALRRPGLKRALKVVDHRAELEPVPDGHEIEERPGIYRRCLLYCEAAPFCKQWAETERHGEA